MYFCQTLGKLISEARQLQDAIHPTAFTLTHFMWSQILPAHKQGFWEYSSLVR